MQKYECKPCGYLTDRLTNLERHNNSKSHHKITDINDHKNSKSNHSLITTRDYSDSSNHEQSQNDMISYVCKYCNQKFSNKQNHNRHVNHWCKLKDAPKSTSVSADPIIINMLKQMSEQISTLSTKLEEQDKKIDNIKNNDSDIIKIAKNTSETANKSMSILKIATKKLGNAPVLKKESSGNIIKLLEYRPDGDALKKYPIEDVIVFNYESNTLIDFIGNIIITNYTHENPKKQSAWGTDISRLTFIIKKNKRNGKNNESEWTHDYNGVYIMRTIIDPIYDEVKNIMCEYSLKIYKKMINDSLKPSDHTYLASKHTSALEILGMIKIKKFQRSTLKYIAPHFGFDSSITDIIDEFDSPSFDSEKETNDSKTIAKKKKKIKNIIVSDSDSDSDTINIRKKKIKKSNKSKSKHLSSSEIILSDSES